MLFCKIYLVIKIRALSFNFVFITKSAIAAKQNLSRIRIRYHQGGIRGV